MVVGRGGGKVEGLEDEGCKEEEEEADGGRRGARKVRRASHSGDMPGVW